MCAATILLSIDPVEITFLPVAGAAVKNTPLVPASPLATTTSELKISI